MWRHDGVDDASRRRERGRVHDDRHVDRNSAGIAG
jgi:hypothetical protein